MKKAFLIVFSLWSLFSFAQQVNEYEFVIVPTKFDFQKSENEYRLNTLLKYRLEEFGFNAFYTSDQMNSNFSDRCLYLNANVVNESTMFLTKLYVVFKNCDNAIVFQSDHGTSKIKERKESYKEALEEALLSVKAVNYKFTGKANTRLTNNEQPATSIVAQPTEVINENSLFAQPIANGYQLVDTTPKVILKIFRTSQADYYTASSDTKNGVVFKKNNVWIFEYYKDDQLISEQLNIKF